MFHLCFSYVFLSVGCGSQEEYDHLFLTRDYFG